MMIGKMFEAKNKLVLEYNACKGQKTAHERGLKKM